MPVGLVTSLVLLAFAANSLLCRWALREFAVDPELFTLVRLWSGALTLVLLLVLSNSGSALPDTLFRKPRHWWLGGSLFIYAAAFSAAYVSLDTGLGAFLLFTTVQLAVQGVSWWRGDRFGRLPLLGMAMALAGLAWLLLPGSGAVDLSAAGLMIIAGLGWSGFVVLGQGGTRPLQDVRTAFVVASLMSLLLLPWVAGLADLPWQGWALALASGCVASGVGYFGWYRVLPALGLQLAGQLQLLVPVMAVLMGVLVLDEALSLAMVAAMALIVAGVLLVLRFKDRT